MQAAHQLTDSRQAIGSNSTIRKGPRFVVQAAETFDVAALKRFWVRTEDIINSEDPVMDKQNAMKFAAKAKEKARSFRSWTIQTRWHHLWNGRDGLTDPLVKDKGKWSFDTNLGREEILNRRIGANELDAITFAGFVEAQHDTPGEAKIRR